MSQAQIKKTAKALFAKIHNFKGIVTTYIIKKQYPKFKASIPDNWQLLILKLLGYNSKANKITPASNLAVVNPAVAIDALAGELNREYGIYITSQDTFNGYSYRFSHHGVNMGHVGYSNIRKQFYCSFGRNGKYFFFNDLKATVTRFLALNTHNIAS